MSNVCGGGSDSGGAEGVTFVVVLIGCAISMCDEPERYVDVVDAVTVQ
jgi:hypothetical protein